MSVIDAKKLLYRNYRQEITSTSNNDIKGLEVGKFERPDFYVEYEIESGNKKVKLTVISGIISGSRTYTYKSSGNAKSEVFASVTTDNKVLVDISGMKSKTVNISSNVISGDIDSLTASNYTEGITDGSAPFEEFYKKYTLKATDSIGVEADEVNITGKTTITGETTIVGKTIVNESTVVIDNDKVEIDGNLDVTNKVTTETFESTGNSSIGGDLKVINNIETETFTSLGKSEVKGDLEVTGKTILTDGNNSIKMGESLNKISLTATDIDLSGKTGITGTLNVTDNIKTNKDFEGDQIKATNRLITTEIMPNHKDEDNIYTSEGNAGDPRVAGDTIVIGRSVEYDTDGETIKGRGTTTHIKGVLQLDGEDLEFKGITKYEKVEIYGKYLQGDRPLQVYYVDSNSNGHNLFNIEAESVSKFKTTFDTDFIVNGDVVIDGTFKVGLGTLKLDKNLTVSEQDTTIGTVTEDKLLYGSGDGVIESVTESFGTKTKPIYIDGGEIKESDETVGSGTKPVYMNAGTITASNSDVGSGTKPVYMSKGAITASNSDVGSSTKPVYMSKGAITAITTGDLQGTDKQIEVDGGTGSLIGTNVKLSLPDDVETKKLKLSSEEEDSLVVKGGGTISGDLNVESDLVVKGELSIYGSLTTINIDELKVDDHQIILGNTSKGIPSDTSADGGGIKLARSSGKYATLLWNEKRWQADGNDIAYLSDIKDETLTIKNGDGITGSGTFTANQNEPTEITISHDDTSTQTDMTTGGRTYINYITLDDYGHVTELKTNTEKVVDTDTTYSISTEAGANSNEEIIRLTAGGSGSGTDDIILAVGPTGATSKHGLTIEESGDTITFRHADTSTKGSLTANSRTYIDALTIDEFGHVTNYTTSEETVVDTHYTAANFIGKTGTQTNDLTTNENTYLKLVENSTIRSSHKIAGSGATTVASDANGNITISSANNYLTGVTGSGNGTVTFARGDLDGLTWSSGHSHGDIKSDGSIGTQSDQVLITTTSGKITTAAALSASRGGTGRSTLTSGAFIIGNGTSAVTMQGNSTSNRVSGTKYFTNLDLSEDLNFASDERMKSKHFKFDDKDILKKLSSVDIYEYNFLNKPDEIKIGLMAQDLQESFPELELVENKGYNEEYDLEDSLVIKHDKLTYVLWSALKGANERIDELEERLSKLEELINK